MEELTDSPLVQQVPAQRLQRPATAGNAEGLDVPAPLVDADERGVDGGAFCGLRVENVLLGQVASGVALAHPDGEADTGGDAAEGDLALLRIVVFEWSVAGCKPVHDRSSAVRVGTRFSQLQSDRDGSKRGI